MTAGAGNALDLVTDLLALEETDSFLVVTGAGVSVASGIPTFRGSDPDAVWARDTTQMGTHRYFVEDPVGSWRWYLDRFEKVVGARPNPAHQALADMERWHKAHERGFLLVTQNIDGLHRAAGSEDIVEVHGRADRFRCSRDGCNLGAPTGSIARADVDLGPFLGAPSPSTLPRCPACSSLLRQHVLWFDERYDMHGDYQVGRALYAAQRARVVLFAGTSFAVGITAMILEEAANHSANVYSIDPTPRPSGPSVRAIVAPAEVALPALRDALSAAS